MPVRSLSGILAITLLVALVWSGAEPSRASEGYDVPATTTQARLVAPTKVLTIIEENHSLRQMRRGMPYLTSLANRYAYATSYTAITHPSLPNYLAVVGGSTFKVTDDSDPAARRISGRSIFDQALRRGKTARTYAESMPDRCALVDNRRYLVRHNPWAYFVDSRASCRRYDVPAGSASSGRLHRNVRHNRLPNIGFLIPNRCNDAHDCPLGRADAWLQARLPEVLASRDFTSGRLVVVVTADEDDRRSGNEVLTVVLSPHVSGDVVRTPLSHYSLLGYLDHVVGAHRLRRAAPGFAHAFGL